MNVFTCTTREYLLVYCKIKKNYLVTYVCFFVQRLLGSCACLHTLTHHPVDGIIWKQSLCRIHMRWQIFYDVLSRSYRQKCCVISLKYRDTYRIRTYRMYRDTYRIATPVSGCLSYREVVGDTHPYWQYSLTTFKRNTVPAVRKRRTLFTTCLPVWCC